MNCLNAKACCPRKKAVLDLIYLNILNSELGLVDVIRTKQVLIVEPFYTGTTRYAVKSLNGGNKVVESIGVPKKFHVDYINYGERIKEIGLDSSAIEFLVQKIICRKL